MVALADCEESSSQHPLRGGLAIKEQPRLFILGRVKLFLEIFSLMELTTCIWRQVAKGLSFSRPKKSQNRILGVIVKVDAIGLW